MSTSNMNFGPEWMRRLSRANSNQNLEGLGQMSGQAGMTSPDQSYSPEGSSFPSPFSNGVSSGNNQSYANSYSSVTSKQKAEAARLKMEDEINISDSLNPFSYSKEMMLSLYRPTDAPLDFERHEYVCSDDTLAPMAHFPLSEAESALLASGQINSIARRNPSAPYPAPGSARGGDRHRDSGAGRGRGTRPQGNKAVAPTASNPWPGATKNSIGSFGADGMFRLDGVSDIILEPREYDPRADRFEAEMQAQQLAYASAAQEDVTGLSYGAAGNQTRFNEESIPIDPSGVAPRSGRGSLKNILAGLAGFDIDNPEAPVGPTKVSNWFYKDPTGATQGPFSGFDMHEWYKLGYFTGDLLVRREEESTFEPLAILISRVDDDDKPFLTPPRAAHLRTILTPRSARGFLNQGYEPDQLFMEQQQHMNPFYPEVLSKEALFQEAAMYQAQQERQHYLQLLQREQSYQMMNGYAYNQDSMQMNYPVSPLADPSWPSAQQPSHEPYLEEPSTGAPDAAAAILERLQIQDPEPEAPQQPVTPPPKPKSKKTVKKTETSSPESRPESTQPAPWQSTSKPAKSFLQIQKEEEEAEKSRAQTSPEVRRYADTVVKQPAHSWGAPQRTPPTSGQAPSSVKEKTKPKQQINPNNPPPPSEKFLGWCKSMLRGLIDIKVDDVVTMLLGFPLDPPPHFKEIVQELFYEQRNKGNKQLVDSHKFAHEYVIRRKVDCGLLSADALPSPGLKPPQVSSSTTSTNDSFQVVSKKTRKRAN